MKNRTLTVSEIISNALFAFNESHAGIPRKAEDRMWKSILTYNKFIDKVEFENVDNKRIAEQIKLPIPANYQKPLIQSFSSCGFGVEVG